MNQDLNLLLIAAQNAATQLREWPRTRIEEFLHTIADEIDQNINSLVDVAEQETNLPRGRLTGEIARTSGQWRHMANMVASGSYLGVIVDHADPTTVPPKPDIRQITIPLGVIGVFGASNFPFAFGVAGGDTASAIAAGCPVIVKAHSGHLETSRMMFNVLLSGARKVGAPAGVFGIIEGREVGVDLVKHPILAAAAFTGSTHGGRALFDAACARPHPIPFYAELGGLNPIFVTSAAQYEKSEEIAQGFLDSVSLGAGQFCTKPGYLVVVNGAPLRSALKNKIPLASPHAMLNSGIKKSHDEIRDQLSSHSFFDIIGVSPTQEGLTSPLTILEISGADLLAHREEAVTEVFGPTAVLVNCKDEAELLAVARAFGGSLTSGIHTAREDSTIVAEIMKVLESMSGRVLMNSWPTGVTVTWAMHHGGPYPASTFSSFTSVGANSIARFRRPVSFQNTTAEQLPFYLQDDHLVKVPRRIDGVLYLAE